MSDIYIVGHSNMSTQGITIEFNRPVSLNGGLEAKEWWVSWDTIGRALIGEDYDSTNRNEVSARER